MNEIATLRLRFGPFEFDEANARLTCAGEAVALAPKAFEVLGALLRRPGQLLTKDALLDAVWGHRHVSDSVLKTTVSELRAALRDDARSPRWVETAARRGYRFIGAVEVPVEALAPDGFERTAFPASPAPAGIGAGAIIGRDAALARLQQAWADAAGSGRRRICFVTGEAGIGKTTLVDCLAAALGDAAQAHGQCVEQVGAVEPYLPVLDALAGLVRHDAALLPLLRQAAPTWLLQMPWLTSAEERERLRSGLAASTQERMLREFSELIERYTADRPLLLVTEDLHWCDDATVRLLDHVARRRASARLLWIASFRIAELVAEDHPLNGVRHELRARRLCEELPLEPFSERELADYVGQRLPARAADEAWVRRLHRQTDGLPLFVANAIDVLAGAPCPEAVAAESGDDWAVPDTLAGVIERQLARLDAGDAQLLEAAAVCGVEFGSAMLAEMLEVDPVQADARCDALARRQYWLQPAALETLADGRLDARFQFRHALYRQVLQRRLGAARRAALHRRAAAAIERRGAAGLPVSAAALALHHELGLDLFAAVRAYAAAAGSALGRFAPAEAAQLTERALALLPRCPEGVPRLELEFVLTHLQAGAFVQSKGVYSADTDAAFRRAQRVAELLPPSAERAWVFVGLSWALMARGQYVEAESLAARVQRLAQAHGHRLLLSMACSARAAPLAQWGRLAEADALAREAVEIAGTLDELPPPAIVLDPRALALAVRAAVCAHLGRADEAVACAAAAQARAEARGQPTSRGFAARCAGIVLARLGLVGEARALARHILGLVREHGLLQGEPVARVMLGWAESELGDAAAGQREILAGIEMHAARSSWFDATLSYAQAAHAALRAGDVAAAAGHVEAGFEVAEGLGERIHLPTLLLARAAVAWRRGDTAAARTAAQEAARAAAAMGALVAELAARVALCDMAGGPADREALRAVRTRWGDGGDIPLLREADRHLA
jgi:DNA-binding winged helix-turn-helix (wHTH) protein